MKRSILTVCLVAVISLLTSAIWQSPAQAAVAPSFASLGQIEEGLAAPGRLDVDGSGNIFVADTRAGGRGGSVLKYDKFGQLTATFRTVSVTGSGIAVTPDGSRVYVAGIDTVHVLDGNTGEVLGALGAGAGEFGRVGEIDLDSAGNIYAADQFSKTVRIYNAEGVFQSQFGSTGTGNGQFLTVWTMAVNEYRNEIYVADSAHQGSTVKPRMQVFDLAGNWLRTMSSDGGFGIPPDGLAVDAYTLGFFGGMTFDNAGRGYFLDSVRDQIRVMGLPTTYLAVLGESGYDAGQLKAPTDAIYDPASGRLFVVDAKARVGIYGIDGAGNPAPPATNVKPGLPVPLSPVAGSEVSSVTPELNFGNAVDSDGDTLTYDVRVFQGEALIEEQVGLPESADNSYAQVATALEENSEYQWTVQAFDGAEGSGWSALESFFVNAVEEPPTAAALTAPLSGEALGGSGELSWQVSADPDPFDVVSYVVQIATDGGFADPVVEQTSVGSAIALSNLVDYAALQVGTTYFWRVKAVDEHGLETVSENSGSFSYEATMLSVTANMPGARVYVGGNFGFAGRFLGETPLELRDFSPGIYSIVVERGGFEPFIEQVTVVENAGTSIYAELVPALAPTDLKARPLQAGGVDIVLSGDAAPFAVDFDNDGLTDLLVAEASGAITVYPGVDLDGSLAFGAGTSLDIGLVPGASIFVADWDNDGRKDLLVGGADGTVNLFLNSGSESAPAFGSGSWLQVDGAPLAVGSDAVPAVIDLDDDGRKDLVVGSGAGEVKLYTNVGSDDLPQLVAAGNLASLSSPVAPLFADWDGDGIRELLLAASEHLYRYVRSSTTSPFAAVEVLAVGDDLVGKAGKSSGGAFALGDRLRLFALDLDGAKGKDLIIANSAGEVRLVASHGTEPVASFTVALKAKVAEIDELVEVGSPSQAIVDELASALDAGDLKNSDKLADDLVGSLSSGTQVAALAEELAKVLN